MVGRFDLPGYFDERTLFAMVLVCYCFIVLFSLYPLGERLRSVGRWASF